MKNLKLRNEQKSRKPDFERCQSNYRSGFEGVWRKGRGKTNKMRRCRRGHKAVPVVGYGSPADVSGLMRSGLRGVLVRNAGDLGLLQKGDIAVIGGSVGARKKLVLLEEIKKKGFDVFNVKDADAYAVKVKSEMEKRRKEAGVKKERRTKSKKEAEERKSESERKDKESEERKSESERKGKEGEEKGKESGK